MNPDEFAELVMGLAAEARGPFKPHWWHNRDGDMIEIYWSEEAYVAKWLNHQVTLLYSATDPTKVIGVQIEGIKRGMTKDGSVS